MAGSLPPTEQSNPLSAEMDSLSALDFARLMNRIDAAVPLAIAEVLPQIARAIEIIAAQIAAGGRLFYQGAGTSGRLGVLDATELVPTFSFPRQRAIALIAGGDAAVVGSVERAEDSVAQGRADLEAHAFSAADILIGIAASGRTPYVIGGLNYAAEIGASTIAVVCNPDSPVAAAADVPIEIVTGPEILTGSTRLKAGTAQKMVLNMLSTGAMVQLGKVYGNLMVDVQPTNEKLEDRAIRIVDAITGVGRTEARRLLKASGWSVKTAAVMGLAEVDADEARRRLDASGGRVRHAVSRGR
ncbi:MAG: N-acetylmuramic acid 6-phosphate etherase [Caldilineaceae bacterium]|nr:N-acetylmuramic acid 6-phosphate etherase [Caldilineaceae bacterium]